MNSSARIRGVTTYRPGASPSVWRRFFELFFFSTALFATDTSTTASGISTAILEGWEVEGKAQAALQEFCAWDKEVNHFWPAFPPVFTVDARSRARNACTGGQLNWFVGNSHYASRAREHRLSR